MGSSKGALEKQYSFGNNFHPDVDQTTINLVNN